MLVGILSLPPSINYGGILQTYALQTILEKMGYTVVVLDRRNYGQLSFIKILIFLKKIFYRYILFDRKKYHYDDRKKEYYNSEYTPFVHFVNKKLKLSEPLYTSEQLRKFVKDNSFNAIIVGSDQVWNPSCSPCIENYFFNFIKDENIIKIAYGASFGNANMEYLKNPQYNILELIKKINAISVREHTSIDLCKKMFDIESKHVLDPTMLLSYKDYLLLSSKCEQSNNSIPFLLSYILDKSEWNINLQNRLFDALNVKKKIVLPVSLEEGHFVTIEQWIDYFSLADFIVTDSFHGCVFSIIFNKPFIAIGNKSRGLDRIKSLLSTFELSDRLICENDVLSINVLKNVIDWNKVNTIWENKRKDSLFFLKYNL